MILYAKKAYAGGSFFKYLNIGFLKIAGDSTKVIDLVDDEAVIYPFGQADNFFEQVGKNTDYIIHPEEILAENFVFAIENKKGLADQWIVDAIGAYLQQ